MRALKHIMATMAIVQPKQKAGFWLPVKPFFGPICVTRLLCSEKDTDHLEKTQTSKKDLSSRKHHLQRKQEQIWDFCYEVKHAGEINERLLHKAVLHYPWQMVRVVME